MIFQYIIYPYKLWCEWQDRRNFREGSRKLYPLIQLNQPNENAKLFFPQNTYSTTKYSLLTFIPKILVDQFRKATTFYFLFILVVTCFPSISPLPPWSQLVGVLFIIIVNMIREGIDDLVIFFFFVHFYFNFDIFI